MLMAQLRGKLPGDVWQSSEDLLTSAVFGSLKYLPPAITAGILARSVSLEPGSAPRPAPPFRWHFWPWWGTCEPDVVIEDDRALYLIEAKLYSDFGQETATVARQLRREWTDGLRHSASCGKSLHLIAVTNHTTIPADTLRRQLAGAHADLSRVSWLSWTDIGRYLRDAPCTDEGRGCVDDLLELLARMGLAPFDGFADALTEARALPRKDIPWASDPLPPLIENLTRRRIRFTGPQQTSSKGPPTPTLAGGFAAALNEAREWAAQGAPQWRLTTT
jgi:hypothetical protein